MTPRVLLDTHIVVRWFADPKRLSRDQTRIINEVIRRRETVAISAITLLEIALLFSDGPLRSKLSMDEVTIDIAKEVSALGTTLRDPADRVIVATARVHGLRLVTSDQRIIECNVVSTVE